MKENTNLKQTIDATIKLTSVSATQWRIESIFPNIGVPHADNLSNSANTDEQIVTSAINLKLLIYFINLFLLIYFINFIIKTIYILSYTCLISFRKFMVIITCYFFSFYV